MIKSTLLLSKGFSETLLSPKAAVIPVSNTISLDHTFQKKFPKTFPIDFRFICIFLQQMNFSYCQKFRSLTVDKTLFVLINFFRSRRLWTGFTIAPVINSWLKLTYDDRRWNSSSKLMGLISKGAAQEIQHQRLAQRFDYCIDQGYQLLTNQLDREHLAMMLDLERWKKS